MGLLLAFPFFCKADPLWPEEGMVVLSDNQLVLDASHLDQGYVLARVAQQTNKRLKLRVAKGKTTLDYDLVGDGNNVVIPLQLGSGKYDFSLYINASGKKYSAGGKMSLDAQLVSEDVCFLYPNQYVNYTPYTQAVLKAQELCTGLSSPQEIYNTVMGFMETEFSYDFVRAKKIKAAELPAIDACFEARAGICQDLSAVMSCMLRTQGVPCKLMIGYADKYYHSWITTVINGEEIFYDPTAGIGAMKAKKYTVERYY